MEENVWRGTRPASTDLAVTGGCTTELTLSNSCASSLTVENSKDTLHQSANARPDPLLGVEVERSSCQALVGRMESMGSQFEQKLPKDKFIQWTDEKHNLYLDYLEESFLKKLHQSMGLSSWCSKEKRCGPSSSQNLSTKSSDFSKQNQLSVARDGCWQKINLKKNKLQLEYLADSHVDRKNSWAHHFMSTDSQDYHMRCEGEMHLMGMRTSTPGLATSSAQLHVGHLWHQYSVGSVREFSDQNFVDEDGEEKPNGSSRVKRLKTAVADASSQDQVATSGEFYMAEISSDIEEQVRHKWQPEKLESFVCPEPDLKYFLRES